MKKVIIFDIDGTLYDTKEGIIKAFNHTLKDMNREKLTEEYEDMIIGPSVRDSFLNLIMMSEDEAEKATAMYREYYVEKYVKLSHMYMGGEETLRELKNRGYILGIATMKTMPQVKKLLEESVGCGFFSIIKTAVNDGRISKAQMLEEIKREVRGTDYYMIGDTEGDYLAALAANMNYIYAAYGYGNVQSKEEIVQIENVSELLELF